MTNTITLHLRDLLREHLDDLLEFNAVGEGYDLDLDDLLARGRAVALLWDTAHVRDLRPDLDDAQAWEVLDEARRSWDRLADPMLGAIRQAADALYPPVSLARARLRERLVRPLGRVETLPSDGGTDPALYDALAAKLDAVEAAFGERGGAG